MDLSALKGEVIMDFKRFGSKIVMRLDKGEEIVKTVKEFCGKNGIKLASVSAIGAVNKVDVGIFIQDTKEYHSKEFTGSMEIVSLLGNISQKQGEVYAHFHINLIDTFYGAFGGHLNEAWVGATCELVFDVIEGEVERKFNEAVGLNLFKF